MSAGTLFDLLMEVSDERQRQDHKFGEQNHPDGTGGIDRERVAKIDRFICDAMTLEGRVSWTHILQEEVSEALAETDQAKLRTELIQVAAVAINWIQAIDRRGGK